MGGGPGGIRTQVSSTAPDSFHEGAQWAPQQHGEGAPVGSVPADKGTEASYTELDGRPLGAPKVNRG